ncbi:MAG TPA: 4Fe-4S binding protein [Thermoflexia bacterium]|nr:4Fe-4S binding protein [Thermoflexia bacterium]
MTRPHPFSQQFKETRKRSSRSASCGLCVSVCPQGAIEF